MTHKPLLKAHPGRDSRGRMYNMYEGEYSSGGVIGQEVFLSLGVYEKGTHAPKLEECVWKFNSVEFRGFDALTSSCLPGLLNSDDPSWNTAKVKMPSLTGAWKSETWEICEVLELAADTDTLDAREIRYHQWLRQQEHKENWRKVRLGLAAQMKTSPIGTPAQGLMQVVPGTFSVNIESAPDPLDDLADMMSMYAKYAHKQFEKLAGSFEVVGKAAGDAGLVLGHNKPLLDCDVPDQPFPVRTPNTGPNKKESHAARIKRSQQLPHANARANTGAHRLGAIHTHTRRGRENRTRARS